MPLYMDVHTLDGGVAVDDVAKAHMADLQTQGKYDVQLPALLGRRGRREVFCLVEAPSPDAVEHRAPRGARPGRRRGLRGQGGVLRATRLAIGLRLSPPPRHGRTNSYGATSSARMMRPQIQRRSQRKGRSQPGHCCPQRHPEVPDFRDAKAHGYGLFHDINGVSCISMPGMGGMGVHSSTADNVGTPWSD